VELAPGLHWLRMPLPIALNHINLWLLEEGDGYTLIDSGLPVAECTAVWEALETTLLRQRPLRRILLTHFHPDHMGCAGWLQQRHGVPVRMAARARPAAVLMVDGPDAAARAAMVAYFAAHGIADAAEFTAQLYGSQPPWPFIRLPQIDQPLQAGEILQAGDWRFEVLETDGHAVAHHCFFSRAPELLISGDQVLPAISPNISLSVDDWGQDPLGEYLASLDLLETLPADTLVLPSHGRPFRGLHIRTADLRRHHQEHLDLLLDRLATPQTASGLMPVLYSRHLEGLHRMLGLHECVAHLEHLVRRGAALRDTAADGRYSYRRAQA
jgi:glyoxylase-like metal-dependent hydrolase (beta-lactamase superfamily II)